MNVFDTRTALLIVGLFYLLLPTVAWIVLAGQRTRQVALWCGGGLTIGASSIAIGLHDLIPEWAALHLPALLFIVANIARIQSLRLDLGIPWRRRWIVLAVAVFFAIFLGLHFGLRDSILRAQFFSVVNAALLFHLAALAWRLGREEQSRNAKWIAGVYALAATTLLWRAAILIGADGQAIMVNEGISSQLFILAMLLASVIGHFSYVGLALDRSTRREFKAIAERIRDEENRRLGEQIAQLDRQRSLGEMSASLGHELNQPLSAILTNAQVAQRVLAKGRFDAEQLGEFLDKIVQNTRRASQIIERIRGFIRPSDGHGEPVDLGRLVREVAELVADEARSRKVAFVFPERNGPIQVMGDPIQLSQIVLNAFRNAIEALSLAARREIQVSWSRSDGRVALRIRDTGPGLSPEALARAGTPFYTTKPSGLGMGLSISHSIARQHGGALTIANANEGGAVVVLHLPLLPEPRS